MSRAALLRGLLVLSATGGLLAAPGAARAETWHDCTGFIDTLPATIARQGVWCLREDLATALASGTAITIAANNVTIDCNGFKIGGQAAGMDTTTTGIHAEYRQNTTVRNCAVRGFLRGILLNGRTGGGHVVEDNRVEDSTSLGIFAEGDGSVIRRNQVLDTGGAITYSGSATGIFALGSVDIADNTIGGVAPRASDLGNATAYGLFSRNNAGGTVIRNRIRGVVATATGTGTGSAYGIVNDAPSGVLLSANQVVATDGSAVAGITCNTAGGLAKGNVILGFPTPLPGCTDLGNSP